MKRPPTATAGGCRWWGVGGERERGRGIDPPPLSMPTGGLVLVESALGLIEQLVYKPGWSFVVSTHPNFENTIRLRINYPSWDTAREQAPLDYPTPCHLHASFPIMVGALDACELYRRILWAILCIEEHEAREFLRVEPTYWAPFHPHRLDGMRRWGNVERDLTFGVC